MKALGYNSGLDVSFDPKQAIIDYYPRPINGGLLFGVKITNLPVTLEGFILVKNMSLEIKKGYGPNNTVPVCPKELVDLMAETSDQTHEGQIHLFYSNKASRWELHLNNEIVITSEGLATPNAQMEINPKPLNP